MHWTASLHAIILEDKSSKTQTQAKKKDVLMQVSPTCHRQSAAPTRENYSLYLQEWLGKPKRSTNFVAVIEVSPLHPTQGTLLSIVFEKRGGAVWKMGFCLRTKCLAERSIFKKSAPRSLHSHRYYL